MRIGEFLVVQGLVTPEAVEAALKYQKQKGGRLGQHLVAMGAVTPDKLSAVLPGLQRWQAMHGPNHPNMHRARYSYARSLLAADRPAEAMEHAEAALIGYRATVGEQHAWAAEALQLIADAREAVAKAEDAAKDIAVVEG
jgi:hypothetical protein